MGERITLNVTARTVFGKKVAKLRKEGFVPGVVYGAGIEPHPIQAQEGELAKVLRAAGKHTPVMLTIDGKKRIAMVKDVENEPTRAKVIHVSFHAVNQNQSVIAEVPIHLDGEGESIAEKTGLIVLQNIEHIEVKALPLDLPDELLVNIRELAVAGDRLTLGDIVLPENVEFVEHKTGHEDDNEDESEQPSLTDLVVVTVYEPSALQAANEAAAGDAETADAEQVEAVAGEEKPAESSEKTE